MTETSSTIIALDVGERRVGVAVSRTDVRLPQAVGTLERTDDFWTKLMALIAEHAPGLIVVGYPRSLDGNTTQQTSKTITFTDELKEKTHIPIVFQDETLTSVKAKAELEDRGKPYQKGEVDALAATYILADYLETL